MKNNRNRHQFWLFPACCLAGIIIALLMGVLSWSPAIAQGKSVPMTAFSATVASPRSELSLISHPQDYSGELLAAKSPERVKKITTSVSKAPIILDGRELFLLSQAGDYPAEFRAEWINTQLKQAAQSSVPVTVKVEERNQLPTILLNDQYLLTVTQLDAIDGMTPTEQADIWAKQIQQALQQAQQERSADFIQQALIQVGAMVMFALALHWFLGHIWRHYIVSGLQRVMPVPANSSPDSHKLMDVLLNLTLASARMGLWLATIFNITNLFPLTRQWIYRLTNSLGATFTSPILTLSQNDYTVTDLLILMALLFGVVFISGIATNLVRSRILGLTGFNRGAQEAVAVIIKYSLIILGTLVVLQIWGLDISSLTILASALGVGIGFGFQDIAKNFGSGLVLIFERPIQVGDFIEVGTYMGTVERIGARSTLIRTLNNVSIIVPNSRFLETEVINWSHHNPVSRLKLPVGVAYGSDIDRVKLALLDATRDHEGVLPFPAPQILFKDFGESYLNFELLVWTKEPSKQYILKSDIYFRIEEIFRQRDIQIPFPQRDLHLHSEDFPLSLSPELERILSRLLERLGNQQNGTSDVRKKAEHDRIERD